MQSPYGAEIAVAPIGPQDIEGGIHRFAPDVIRITDSKSLTSIGCG